MFENSFDEGQAAYDNQDYSKAFGILLPHAEEGLAEAQCMIGSMYHLGLGIHVNGAMAVTWYRRAAEQGHPLAYHNLGCLYHTGVPDLQPDPEKATECYRKAEEHGFDMILPESND